MPPAVHSLHPLFGAEITGVDLAEPMEDATFARIRAAFEEHSLLLFRGQAIDDAMQMALSERFGPVLKSTKSNTTGGTTFSRQSNIDPSTGELIPGDDRRMVYQLANRLWHSDGSYREWPALCSLLSARIVPGEGGATEFATMRAAYDALPAERRNALEGLAAEHSLIHSRARIDPAVMTEEQKAEIPPVHQALIRTNPVNGRKALFVGAHASHILGMKYETGRALLEELLEFATQPQFVYSHAWRQGDLIVYDNRAVLHRATPFDAARHKRLLQRTTVAGDGPTAPQPERKAV